MSDLAPLLQRFFTDKLDRHLNASPHTKAAYADTFRLLLGYAQRATGIAPSALTLADLDADLIGGFLQHLETERGNSPATRNTRRAALRSFFTYASYRAPDAIATISQVLAIPAKRTKTTLVSFLTAAEAEALIATPDTTTWLGRRDRLLLHLGIQTGLRVSELTSLRIDNITIGPHSQLECVGKGRKQRVIPLQKNTVKLVTAWLAELPPQPEGPLFPTSTGTALTRAAVGKLGGRDRLQQPLRARQSSPRARAALTSRATAARSALPALVVFIAAFGIELMPECVSVIGDQPSSPTSSACRARTTV